MKKLSDFDSIEYTGSYDGELSSLEIIEAADKFLVAKSKYGHLFKPVGQKKYKLKTYNVAIMLITEELDAKNIRQQEIPSEAPELWPGKRHTKETVQDFFRRVWSGYLKYGLLAEDILRMDEKLWHAIRQTKKIDGAWPEDLKLPTQRSNLEDALEKYKKEGMDALTPSQAVAVARRLLRNPGTPSPR